ncbi:uncharacterized protein LOC126811807 [Patella vulgata]|uniref:uncharacterized protein LOC126811807 n=1 Tax=Patella vulgata TaxID=6465 RepID=UPI0024A8C248|nr:uncharacterized protein LOC126811807 [Patella vulgata]
MDNVGQYSTDDSLTTLSTGCSLTDPNNHPEPQSASSVDSDLITAWVDDELQKVQRDLQQEVSMCTPTKEDEDERPADLLEEIMDEVCRPKFEQYPASRNDRKAKRYTRKEDLDPFEDDSVDDCRNYSYTDRKRYKEDDFILHKPRNSHNYSDGEHRAYYDIFSDDNYLDLPSVQAKKKPKTKSKRNTHTNTESYMVNNKSNSTGYLTTVRVETSLQHPGHHFLTHTSKDLSTGKTKTIHSEEITADRIQSSIGTE